MPSNYNKDSVKRFTLPQRKKKQKTKAEEQKQNT